MVAYTHERRNASACVHCQQSDVRLDGENTEGATERASVTHITERTLSAVQDLARLGLSVIPINQGEKRPHIRWKKYQRKAASVDQLQRWHEEFAGCSWAIVWGAVSGNVMAVDVDSESARQWCEDQGGFNQAPPVWFSTGRGWQYLYRLPPELANTSKSKPHEELDFLTSRCYSVVPPSIHKTGKQYQWQSKPPTSLDDIPFAPQWVLDLITGKLEPPKEPMSQPDSITRTNTPNPSTKASNPAQDRSDGACPAVPENFATNSRLLKSAGYQWLMSSTFTRGSRNSAFLSLAIILRLAGLDQNKAAHELDQWRQKHTTPVYEANEAEDVLDCLYRTGYGLTVQGLMKSINADGDQMPDKFTDELVRLLPSTSRKRGERQNDPIFVSVARIIEVLYQRRIMKPTPITHDQMARFTGLSPDQVAKVAGFLEEIGIKSNARIGRSTVSLYNLNSITSRSELLIEQLARWRAYRIHWKAIRKFLWGRFKNLMRAVLSHLNNVWNWITSTWQGETRQLAAVAVSGSDAGWLNRGPPS